MLRLWKEFREALPEDRADFKQAIQDIVNTANKRTANQYLRSECICLFATLLRESHQRKVDLALESHKNDMRLYEFAQESHHMAMQQAYERQAQGEDKYLSYAHATKKKRAALQAMTTDQRFIITRHKEFGTNPHPPKKPRHQNNGGGQQQQNTGDNRQVNRNKPRGGGRGGGRGGNIRSTNTNQSQNRSVDKKSKTKKPKGTKKPKVDSELDHNPCDEEVNPREETEKAPSQKVWKLNKENLEKLKQACLEQEHEGTVFISLA